MDSHAVVAYPLRAVFEHLTQPERLGDWLPEVLRVERGDDRAYDTGDAFDAILQVDGVQQPAHGEIIALEPPAMVSYRLFTAGGVQVVRVTCVACDAGTRVWIAVSGDGAPLAVDLAGLVRAMTLLADSNEGRDVQSTAEWSA